MSRAVFAMARLTLREALRSRLVHLFGLLLAVVSGGMPLIVKGDGTPAGLIRMTLAYTLGMAFGLLCVATLWTGCALFPGDAARHTLELTRVKPVRPGPIWLGKWLGLLMLDLVLLTGVYLATWAAVARQAARDPAAAAVMQTARLAVKPRLPSLDEQLETYFLQSGGPARKPAEQRELRRQLRREIPFQSIALQRGKTWNWNFTLDRPPDPRQPLWLRFQFDTDAFTRAEVKAQGRLTGQHSGAGVDFLLDDFSTRVFEIPLDAGAFGGESRFRLSLTHAGSETAGPLLLQPRQGLDLLVPRIGLGRNLARSAGLHLSILALLAAIGVSLGALFSLPVAAFCATGILLASLISAFVVSDADLADPEPATASTWQRLTTDATRRTTRGLVWAARPALAPAPLQRLAGAELIPLAELARALLVNGVLLPLLGCLVAAAALSDKELPS